VPPAARAGGGFEMIAGQLRQVHHAFRLAALTNRTLILPWLKCGERPMAYPCYAWYHRAMAYFGVNQDKVPMPEHCPLYYWLDVARLAELALPTREPGFLDNPRTPAAVSRSVARVRFCAKAPCAAERADAPAGAERPRDAVHVPGGAPAAELLEALRPTAAARVLRVHQLQLLTLPGPKGRDDRASSPVAGGVSRAELSRVTHGFWCTACPITRKGAVIHQHNRSVVEALETFCKTEARARLGEGQARSCCRQNGPCHACAPWERKLNTDESKLPWTVRSWVPTLAKLELPPGPPPVCTHPFCTGADRKRFP
jgi:hypothetical protein